MVVVNRDNDVGREESGSVGVPGIVGEVGVVAGHKTFLATLKTGSIRYTDANEKEHFVFVSGGFAEALPDKVTVLAESAEKLTDIDAERARSALSRAEKRLAERSKDDVDFIRAKAALDRALARVKLIDAG